MRMWGFICMCLWRMDRAGKELGLHTCLVSLFLAFTSRLIIYPTLPNTNKHKQANNPNSPKFLLSMTGKADSLLLPYVHQCQLGTKMCSSLRGTSADQWPLPCIFSLTIEKWRESWSPGWLPINDEVFSLVLLAHGPILVLCSPLIRQRQGNAVLAHAQKKKNQNIKWVTVISYYSLG